MLASFQGIQGMWRLGLGWMACLWQCVKERTFSNAAHMSRAGMGTSLYSPLPPAFLISCCTMRPSYLRIARHL